MSEKSKAAEYSKGNEERIDVDLDVDKKDIAKGKEVSKVEQARVETKALLGMRGAVVPDRLEELATIAVALKPAVPNAVDLKWHGAPHRKNTEGRTPGRAGGLALETVDGGGRKAYTAAIPEDMHKKLNKDPLKPFQAELKFTRVQEWDLSERLLEKGRNSDPGDDGGNDRAKKRQEPEKDRGGRVDDRRKERVPGKRPTPGEPEKKPEWDPPQRPPVKFPPDKGPRPGGPMRYGDGGDSPSRSGGERPGRDDGRQSPSR